MSKNANLDALNEHLFDVIERLKDRNDPNADVNDTIDLETATKICEAGKIIVESFKVKAQVLNMAIKASDPSMISRIATGSGIVMIPEQTAAELAAKKAKEREKSLYSLDNVDLSKIIEED